MSMPNHQRSGATMLANDYEDECDPDLECISCGGEGYVGGDEIASSYDYGWIDEDGVYPCTNCGGTGKRSDQRFW